MNENDIKLTRHASSAGWAAKISPDRLSEVLKALPEFRHDKLLAGYSKGEDCAVYEINNEEVLVATLDFFTPILDDAYQFGAVAAANSLSDCYATGANPVIAMNIVCFPDELDSSILKDMLLGGADKVKEANALLVGGHSVKDKEPKYGLSVIGICKKDEFRTNSGSKEGDLLILTKALGTGIISTAIKRGKANKEDEKEVYATMSYLNKNALKASRGIKVNACTDITGFGLVGHLSEMMDGSNLSCNIYYEKIHKLNNVEKFASQDIIPGGTKKNRTHYDCLSSYIGLEYYEELILNDTQTSGGLLYSVPKDQVDNFLENLEKYVKTPFSVIGEVTKKQDKLVNIRR